MIASLKSTGDWKTSLSELSVGDLVFPSETHVGIYIGNGQMIHAPHPGATVTISSVYSFIGGGTY
jgi:cell wall-associated NlpC family hydrolase